jgi:Tol biopolymer transport system component
VLLVLLVANSACVRPAASTPGTARGKLLYVALDGFWAFDLQTRQKARVTRFAPDTFASAPEVSPDGTRVAFITSHFGAGGTSDLTVMQPDGSDQSVILTGVAPADAPSWTPDSQALYVTRRPGGSTEQIERVTLDDSHSQVVVPGAHGVALSPDGRQLVYVVNDAGGGQAIWAANSEGENSRLLLPGSVFEYVATPRFSPDSRMVALAGAPPQPVASVPPASRAVAMGEWLAGTRQAYAHGVPYDIWLLDPVAGSPRRLTNVQAHLGSPSWSADGQWLAFTGEPGLFLVSASGGAVQQLSADGLPAGLTWLRDTTADSHASTNAGATGS